MKVVERQISSILHDLIEASMVAQVCVWKQEVSPGIFNPFPLRISRIIATSYEVSSVSYVWMFLASELNKVKKLHRNYIVGFLKAFERLLSSKVRLEVQVLEFHGTINQDCIATEIK